MNELNGLIFDIDGTVADTEELHRCAFNTAFETGGLDWYWSRRQYACLLSVSGGPDRIRYYSEQCRPTRSPPLSAKSIAELHARKSQLYRQALAEQGVSLRPGIRRLFDDARREGIKLGLATCTSYKNVQQLLDRNLPSDWPTWFDAIVTSDQIQAMKPAPDVYLRALALIKLTPRQCIAVEDTRNGFLAASAAGLTTVVTTNGFTRHCDFAGAGLVVSHLGEPGLPFEVLSCALFEGQYIDVSAMRRILSLDNKNRSNRSSTLGQPMRSTTQVGRTNTAPTNVEALVHR